MYNKMKSNTKSRTITENLTEINTSTDVKRVRSRSGSYSKKKR